MVMALAAAGSASVVLPSLSSSLLLHRKNARNSHSRAHLVACYGIPGYAAPRPYQTPGSAAGTRPSETIANPSFGDRRDFQRTYGAPLDYSTPGKYQTPTSYRAPHAYGTPEGVAVAEDVVEAELDGGGEDGGGGFGDGDDGGSGGGRGDGSDGSQGEEGDEGAKKKESGLSMSQKLTLAYAILVGVGGIMGFAKSGSTKSLMAGGGSASILYYVFLNLPSNPVMASAIGLGISGLLLFIMGSRYLESGKVFPAGVVSLFSLVMAGGYVHGILRSAHH